MFPYHNQDNVTWTCLAMLWLHLLMMVAMYRGRCQWPRGLNRESGPLSRWDCGFESRQKNGCLRVVSVVYRQNEDSTRSWSLIQSNPTECDVSEWDRKASIMSKPWPPGVVRPREKNVKGLKKFLNSHATGELGQTAIYFSCYMTIVTTCHKTRGVNFIYSDYSIIRSKF